jgi:hypothetical protein
MNTSAITSIDNPGRLEVRSNDELIISLSMLLL